MLQHHNHLAHGDYSNLMTQSSTNQFTHISIITRAIFTPHKVINNTVKALIFKMAAVQFLDISEVERNKRKENTAALITSIIIILLFSSGSVNIVK